jgi:hypothetical protein
MACAQVIVEYHDYLNPTTVAMMLTASFILASVVLTMFND